MTTFSIVDGCACDCFHVVESQSGSITDAQFLADVYIPQCGVGDCFGINLPSPANVLLQTGVVEEAAEAEHHSLRLYMATRVESRRCIARCSWNGPSIGVVL